MTSSIPSPLVLLGNGLIKFIQNDICRNRHVDEIAIPFVRKRQVRDACSCRSRLASFRILDSHVAAKRQFQILKTSRYYGHILCRQLHLAGYFLWKRTLVRSSRLPLMLQAQETDTNKPGRSGCSWE
jgi:hypothetical protein